MCSYDMTITARQQLCIFNIAGSQAIVVNLLILSLTVGHNLFVTVAQLLKGRKYGFTIACPIAFVVDIHIAHVFHLVITNHHI